MTRGPEEHIFPVLGELGVGVIAYGVLMHGLLSGTARPAGDRGPRSHLPRFNEENFERNQKLVAIFGEIAKEKGVSNSQLAIAWVLAKGPGIVPVVGARNRTQLLEALGALDVVLSADDNVRIEKAVPIDAVAGSRYASQLMTTLDSERTA